MQTPSHATSPRTLRPAGLRPQPEWWGASPYRPTQAGGVTPPACWIYLLVIVLIVIIYAQTCAYQSVVYDDSFMAGPEVPKALSFKSIDWAFTTFHGSDWLPIPWISVIATCDTFGFDVRVFHFGNMLLHIINTLLLFDLLRRLTGAYWLSALAALLFAVHPLQVESVAHASSRKDLLNAFFALLTMQAYQIYAERPSIRQYLWVMIAFTLCLLSKTALVTLPCVLLLLDYWPLGRFDTDAASPGNADLPIGIVRRQKARRAAKLVVEKMPLFALSLAAGLIMLRANRDFSSVPQEMFPLAGRMANVVCAYVFYIRKMFWPVNLGIYYFEPSIPYSVPRLQDLAILGGVSILVTLCARHGGVTPPAPPRRYLVTGWLWYLGVLIPAMVLLQALFYRIADHHVYVAIVGLFIMIVWGLGEWAARWRIPRPFLAGAATLAILFLATLSFFQARSWRDSESLYRRATAVSPQCSISQNILGTLLAGKGDSINAVRCFRMALELNPDLPDARLNLATELDKLGQTKEAGILYGEVLARNPYDVAVYNNRGNLLVARGQWEEAIALFRLALEIDPNYAKARNNLGLALAGLGHYDEAIEQYAKALEIDPSYTKARYNLGNAHNDLANTLVKMGKLDEAIAHYQETLRINPGHHDAQFNIGAVYLTQGKHEDAVRHLRKALEINPEDATARDLLEHALDKTAAPSGGSPPE